MAHRESQQIAAHQPCPDCGSSDALAIYDDGHTHCFSCKTTRPAPGKRRRERVAGNLIEADDIRSLEKRKISQETCAKYGYAYSQFGDSTVQVAPYRDQSGVIVAQHLRFPNKTFVWLGRSKDVLLWGQHLWRDGGKQVVVTEGEIDCMTVSQLQGNKWPVVSIPSGVGSAEGAFKRNLEWLERFESVVIMFDMDEVGQKAARECALLLTPGRAKIAHLPLKDPNEMLQAGRGKEVIDAMWGAKVYRPDGIISGRDLRSRVKTPPLPGLSLPYPGLQEKTKGIRPGELWMFTAGSGIGKSTLVREIAYHMGMVHGQYVGVLMLEESPERSARGFCGIHLNRPIHTEEGFAALEEGELDAAMDAVLDSDRFWFYEHFGSSDVDSLLSKIRYMVVGLGCQFIVLDHISIVVSGLDEIEESERKTIDRLMTALAKFTEETKCNILAVVHLKRPEKGKGFTEGRIPNLGDLRGSASLEQLSWVVVSLERDQQDEEHPDRCGIRVLKNRPLGYTGAAGYAEYNHATGRLLSVEDDTNPFAEGAQGGRGDF